MKARETMYRPDLSPYTDARGHIVPNVYCIGWLDAEHSFPTGDVPQEVLQCILLLCFELVNQTRGFHPSPFASRGPRDLTIEHNGETMRLGSAEIRVHSKSGKTYAAPNL